MAVAPLEVERIEALRAQQHGKLPWLPLPSSPWLSHWPPPFHLVSQNCNFDLDSNFGFGQWGILIKVRTGTLQDLFSISFLVGWLFLSIGRHNLVNNSCPWTLWVWLLASTLFPFPFRLGRGREVVFWCYQFWVTAPPPWSLYFLSELCPSIHLRGLLFPAKTLVNRIIKTICSSSKASMISSSWESEYYCLGVLSGTIWA